MTPAAGLAQTRAPLKALALTRRDAEQERARRLLKRLGIDDPSDSLAATRPSSNPTSACAKRAIEWAAGRAPRASLGSARRGSVGDHETDIDHDRSYAEQHQVRAPVIVVQTDGRSDKRGEISKSNR